MPRLAPAAQADRMAVWRALTGAALAGALQGLAMAWPMGGMALGTLQILSLATLAWLLLGVQTGPGAQRWRLAAGLGLAFALCWLAATFWWLHISMTVYGGMPAALSVLAVLALAGALGLYYALATAIWVRRASPQRPTAAALAFAALWTLAELARGHFFTGFPWGASGYAHTDSLLAVWAPWLGVYGMGALAAFVAMRLAQLGREPQARLGGLRDVAVVLGLSLGLLAWAPSFTQDSGALRVELLQGNVAQDQKFEAATGVRDALIWYSERLVQTEAELVVAPETAIPVWPQAMPGDYWARLRQAVAQRDRVALVGLPLQDAPGVYTNSALALGDPAAEAWRYDKHHLVPFGEFVPMGFAWFVRQMQIPLGDFAAGPLNAPSLAWKGQRLAPMICYEDLFGEELAARFADPAQAPTVLVNMSNIAWFGDTVAIDQHLAISRLRAMELGRPVIRATNTGATALIDARGQVQDRLPVFVRGSLRGLVQGQQGLTPFARWAAPFGQLPLALLALALALWGLWPRRRD